ncbi:MAG TPA: enoyl-CoA hydratase/isomerase family protein [Acidimicrobiales bacterium]|nr:enoyl-CoA hydratase/isomerase family protein [Acidimicrobiales bacterium]
MSRADDVVQVEALEGGVTVVTLNRPERLNALNPTLVGALHRVFAALDADPEVRAVVLTGAGRGFCAGADLKEIGRPSGANPVQEGATPALFEVQEHIASLHERIHRLRKPVIAAVNGAAVGGGFTLALACDLRLASEAARFGAVFITLGLSNCDMGSSYFLPRLVGAARSAELLLTGRVFPAAEARGMGLVTDVTGPEELLDRAVALGRAIAQNSPLGVWMTKETMWQTIDAPSLRAALDIENRTQVMCAATVGTEGMADAFHHRRTRG